MATPEIPCCEIPVLLIFCFWKTANPETPCGEVPVLLNFQFLQNQQIQRCHVVNSSFVEFPVFVESANPEVPCGKLLVLLVSSFAEQQPQRCLAVRYQFVDFQFL